jgi:threonyl-tRNA synthetase
MIHRALMGSIERFFGILVEHYAGAFPTWLAPVQAVILPISEKQHVYAEALRGQLSAAGFRVEANLRNEKIGLKIREAEKSKIPYMLVVGDREVQNGTISVRGRHKADLGSMAVPNLLDMLRADMTQPSGQS